jgi:hypothetical protein
MCPKFEGKNLSQNLLAEIVFHEIATLSSLNSVILMPAPEICFGCARRPSFASSDAIIDAWFFFLVA